MMPRLSTTTKQILGDLAFTAAFALATGGLVSLVAVVVILVFARAG